MTVNSIFSWLTSHIKLVCGGAALLAIACKFAKNKIHNNITNNNAPVYNSNRIGDNNKN